MQHYNYAQIIWHQFKKNRIGFSALFLIIVFGITGIYAPFLASSKPLIVIYDGKVFFPLFRYLFYTGFYTKNIDIFYNLLMFSLPLFIAAFFIFKKTLRKIILIGIACTHLFLFCYFIFANGSDPASSPLLNKQQQETIQHNISNGNRSLTWDETLKFMTPYAKLNTVMRYRQRLAQHNRLMQYSDAYVTKAKKIWLSSRVQTLKAKLLSSGIKYDDLPSQESLEKEILDNTPSHEIDFETAMPTLYQVNANNTKRIIAEQEKVSPSSYTKAKINYIKDHQKWLEKENAKITFEISPILRHFHWEDDAGGEQNINQYVHWWELTRINHKDLMTALIFGIRISLMVGLLAVMLQAIIGIPIGSFAGYFGGKIDIVITRLLEVWEGVPVFFMLLLVIAITQNKSIFLVITILGIFGWTNISRFIRSEMLKQRNLPYVDACRALGFKNKRIIFSHLLPNAIPPVLTLLPFAILAAITSEAGLSFLGLGEEGSCSWGVLMDEGRQAFPGESYLLWPPAILLTILLIAIALVGDALRDAFDPKLRKD